MSDIFEGALLIMDYSYLKKDIIGIVKESQAKIGYSNSKMHLYYPLASLNSLLDSDFDVEGMNIALKDFASSSDMLEMSKEQIVVSNKAERFCITVPAEIVTYIHKEIEDSPFLIDFLETIQKHEVTKEEIVSVFKRYSDNVVIKEIDTSDFDYLIYFEKGDIDDFRYCFKSEGTHTTYHRFSARDYEMLEIK